MLTYKVQSKTCETSVISSSFAKAFDSYMVLTQLGKECRFITIFGKRGQNG